jgi:hypothetical protein
MGRNTQGVRLIKLDPGERLIGVEAVTPEVEEDGEAAEGLSDTDKTEELPTLT